MQGGRVREVKHRVRVYVTVALWVGSSWKSEWAPRVQNRPTKTVTPWREACSHERLVLQLPNWVVLRKADPPVASVHLWRDPRKDAKHCRLGDLLEVLKPKMKEANLLNDAVNSKHQQTEAGLFSSLAAADF